MKNQKGLTLVALVVTIIVLIILAGISINLILGDNGIITIVKRAKQNTELARIEEETQLNELYTQLETEGSSSGNLPYDSIAKLTEFKTAIANAIEEAGGIKTEISAETTVFADNIKGILKEVTKNATATAEDIADGKTAYVDGQLLTGTMEKNLVNKGSFTSTSTTMTFDCGITNPSVVIAREGNQWTWIYVTCFSKNLAHYVNLSNGANALATYNWDNYIKVDGSNVTLQGTNNGRTVEWIAIL